MQNEAVQMGSPANHRLRNAWLSGSACVLAFFPIPILFAAYCIRSPFTWLWFLLLFAFAGLGTRLAVWGYGGKLKSTLAVWIPGLVVAVGSSYFLCKPEFSFGIIPCSATAMASIYLGACNWRKGLEMPTVPLYLAGLICHFAAYFLFLKVAVLQEWTWLIALTGLIDLTICLFAINHLMIVGLLSNRETDIPRGVIGFNRLMVAIFIGCIWIVFGALALFAFFTHIQDLIAGWLGHLFSGHHTSTLTHKQGPTLPFQKGNGGNHPPSQPQFPPATRLTHILMIITLVLLAAAVLTVIWIAVKYIWRRYQQRSQDADARIFGYVDEQEALERSSVRDLRTRTHPRGHREPSWRDFTSAAEKIRFLYRQTIRRSQHQGYPWQPTDTATETTQAIQQWQHQDTDHVSVNLDDHSAERLITLYNKARYGVGDIADADAESLRNSLTDSE